MEVCSNLTDVAGMAIAEHCPGLTSINLSQRDELTGEAVVTLAELCPDIT